MFLIRLYLLVCVNLFLYAKCSIPVERLCVNQACDEPISVAKGAINYISPQKGVLGFTRGQEIKITSKSNSTSDDDYWGAVINGQAGYVPSRFVREIKVFHATNKLIPVVLSIPNVVFEANSSEPNVLNPSSSVKNEIDKQLQTFETNQGVSNNLENANPVEKPIKPAGTYTIFEGTTIYLDEADEITPSATVGIKSTETAVPSSLNANKESLQKEERATIPPEVIDLNSNFKGQIIGSAGNFTIENVKENDENTVIESKDIYTDDDESEDDEDDEEDENEVEEDEEEEGDEAGDELNVNTDEQPNKGKLSEKENHEAEEKSVHTAANVELNKVPGVHQNSLDSTVNSTVENSVTGQDSAGVGDGSIEIPVEQRPDLSPQQPSGVFGMKFERPQAINSEFAGDGTSPPQQQGMPQMGGTVYASTPSQFMGIKGAEATSATPQMRVETVTEATSPQFIGIKGAEAATAAPQVRAEEVTQATPQVSAGTEPQATSPHFVEIEKAEATYATPQVRAETGAEATTPQFTGIKGVEAAFATPQERTEAVTEATSQVSVGMEPAVTPPQFVGIKVAEAASTTPEVKADIATEATSHVIGQMGAETSAPTPHLVPGSETPGVGPQAFTEGTQDTAYTTQLPVGKETLTMFNQFSVSAEEKTKNFDKPILKSEMIEEKVEFTTEAFAYTPEPVASDTGNKISGSSQTSNVPDVTPDAIHEKVEVTTEDLSLSLPSEVVTEHILPKEESKGFENTAGTDQTYENNAEQPGMLSQITGMFSSWFTSAPKEGFPEEKLNYEVAFQDFTSAGNAETKVLENEAPGGTCQNPELGFDCKQSVEEPSTWSDWIPPGFGFENILKQSSTPIYLVITAVTVLLFTLGHNFIEKREKTGPLIAKINKLEQELLVMSKECIMFKDEVQAAREKIALYENSANDELVLSLQAELEEAKKVRAELESSIEVLQQELDAATEAGLDLNKMLSEVLTQKGGSETLLKSVESLQGQLDSQQRVIDEMTKKLGVKNQENEALQSALEAANDKSENLEEQLVDIKHNLNLHLKEKEDLTRDLNAKINQLTSSSNQLWQTKEEEISKLKIQLEELQAKLSENAGALTVKEEEVKALKESMKHLKTKGDIKMETVFDFSRLKAELVKEKKENHAILEKLKKEESNRKALIEKVNVLESEMQKLKKNFEEAEQKKDEAEKKLEVLSTYFKEKETQLQKELGLQEALWAQKKGDENAVCNMMKSLQEEVESYKSQNETLKKEILDQERGLKNQIAGLEQKAHENWVAARQAERKLEESKQEMSQLRNRLITLMEKNNSNADGKGNRSEELNGVEAASPILHDTSSPLLFPPLPLDPNSSNLLPPGFMPPPMFMPPPIGGFMPPPPFLPGDRRPPPLGRMSSPPLNNRFSPSSPGDYPFERMSSPPLSPPGSNYRSVNEDREHYRHRTPPYPPPLHPRNWDDSSEMPGFIPISSQRDSRRDHKGSNVSSEHSSSESLDKSSRHSGRV